MVCGGGGLSGFHQFGAQGYVGTWEPRLGRPGGTCVEVRLSVGISLLFVAVVLGTRDLNALKRTWAEWRCLDPARGEPEL